MADENRKIFRDFSGKGKISENFQGVRKSFRKRENLKQREMHHCLSGEWTPLGVKLL